MPFLAGEIVTADRLNLLQPKTYFARIPTAVTGAQTLGATGLSVNFDTFTDNARVVINFQAAIDYTAGSVTTRSEIVARIDGVNTLPRASFGQGPGNASDVATVVGVVEESAGSAGNHTVDLVATLGANQRLNVWTSVSVTVYEVV